MESTATRDNLTLLIRYYNTKDRAIRNRIVEENQELVWFVIKRYSSQTATPDDLFQAGVLGLIRAIDNFKPELGTKLSTYAIPHIQNEVRALIDNPEYIDDCAGLTPIDEYCENKLQECLEKLYANILTDGERTVMDIILRTNDEPAWSVHDIAKLLNMSDKQIRDLYAAGVRKMNEPWVRWYIEKIKEAV